MRSTYGSVGHWIWNSNTSQTGDASSRARGGRSGGPCGRLPTHGGRVHENATRASHSRESSPTAVGRGDKAPRLHRIRLIRRTRQQEKPMSDPGYDLIIIGGGPGGDGGATRAP